MTNHIGNKTKNKLSDKTEKKGNMEKDRKLDPAMPDE